MRPFWLSLLLLAGWVACATPAEARLGQPWSAIRRSELVQGERYFRFEGKVGMRYRFTGAPGCVFGNGMLCLDTWNGAVVQQILVLPIPNSPAEERMLMKIAGLFLKETGLPAEAAKEANEAFKRTLKTAKREEKVLDQSYELRTYCDPRLNSLMMVVGLKP